MYTSGNCCVEKLGLIYLVPPFPVIDFFSQLSFETTPKDANNKFFLGGFFFKNDNFMP